MPNFKRVMLVCASVAAVFASLHAVAQQPAPVPPPPAMENLTEGDDPAITIKKPSSANRATENRVQGKVKAVEVHSGGSTYTVRPNEPAGSALPGDGQSDTSRPAQWKVLEFGGPRPTDPDSAPATK